MDATSTTTETAAPVITPADIAALLDKLGLDPATTDVAALLAKIDELIKSQTSGTEMAAQSGAMQAENLSLKNQLIQANTSIEALTKAANERAAADLVEEVGEQPEEVKVALIGMMQTNPEGAKVMIAALKGKPATAAITATPPAPQHDPAQVVEATPADKTAQADALIKTVQGEGKFTDYTSAREEARRRQPELFS